MTQFSISAETTHLLTELLNGDMADEIFDRILDFWNDPELTKYLQTHGYTLYRRLDYDGLPSTETVPALSFEDTSEAKYPYAYYSTHRVTPKSHSLCADDLSGKVVYAQDTELRHVAMKLVLADSDEYRILRFLRDQELETLQENCILPVLNLVPLGTFWLAVMPRWGVHATEPQNHNMHEILRIMHSMLKSLAFLHANNIIHRDMKMQNLLINHFEDNKVIFSYRNPQFNEKAACFAHREQMRKQGKLMYAVIDFNISVMVPRNLRKETYRLPYRKSYEGSGYHPSDTSQGEIDYDPFAFDVGTLGVLFCLRYQCFTKHIPLLAPLLDRMTTRDIKHRFTADQALRFFEDSYSDLTKSQLSIEEYRPPYNYVHYDEYDRWQDLPEEFKRKWEVYREPPIPTSAKLFRAFFINTRIPFHLRHCVRFLLRFISAPRSLYLDTTHSWLTVVG